MKLVRTLIALLGCITALTAQANATYTSYSNESAFLSAVTNAKTDNFNDSGFHLYNNAYMQANSAGHVGYASTGFDNLNIVVNGSLCWGCNGSGRIDLSATNVGTSDGVFGFAATVLYNTQNPTYNAYITFGDNSTLTVTDPRGFFGFTSDSLIKSIEFAHSVGQRSNDGSVAFDKVIVGSAKVPEPGSLALLGLGLMGFAVARRARK